MTNREKYRDEIIRANSQFCNDFLKSRVLSTYGLTCAQISCSQCYTIMNMWMNEEYKEPDVDWSQVPVDTLIEVWDHDNQVPFKRYFAEYVNGMIVCWIDGTTSITAGGMKESWKHCRIAKED